MNAEQIKAIPRRTAKQVMVSIPLGPGFEERLAGAIQNEMNLEFWRGYHLGLIQIKSEDINRPLAPAA